MNPQINQLLNQSLAGYNSTGLGYNQAAPSAQFNFQQPSVQGAQSYQAPQQQAPQQQAPQQQTYQQPQSSSSSSNHGLSNPQVNQFAPDGFRYVGNGQWAAPAAAPNAMPDQTQQINDTYNDVFSSLEAQRQQAQAGYPSLEQTFTAPIDAMRPDLQSAYQQGQNLNQQQQTQTYQNQENALAAARNTYNEVNQGAAQRFGGSNGIGTGVSSAADFANEFYGRQLAQNQGNIYNTTSQNIGQLQAQAQNINSQYQANLQKIDEQKANAVAQAQQVFQQQLQAINQNETAAQQEKAAAKLQLLQDLRGNLQNIQNQYTQFQQTAYLQQQQANNTLRNSIQAYQAMGNNPLTLNTYASPYYAGIGGGAANNPQSPLFTSGQASTTQKVDQFGNPIQ